MKPFDTIDFILLTPILTSYITAQEYVQHKVLIIADIQVIPHTLAYLLVLLYSCTSTYIIYVCADYSCFIVYSGSFYMQVTVST